MTTTENPAGPFTRTWNERIQMHMRVGLSETEARTVVSAAYPALVAGVDQEQREAREREASAKAGGEKKSNNKAAASRPGTSSSAVAAPPTFTNSGDRAMSSTGTDPGRHTLRFNSLVAHYQSQGLTKQQATRRVAIDHADVRDGACAEATARSHAIAQPNRR